MLNGEAWFRGATWSALLLTAALGTDLMTAPCLMHGQSESGSEPGSAPSYHHAAPDHAADGHPAGDQEATPCDCLGACLTCCSAVSGQAPQVFRVGLAAASTGPISLNRVGPPSSEKALSPLARPPPA